MYKVTRKVDPIERSRYIVNSLNETTVWTGYTEQEGIDYIAAQISEDMVNGYNFSYKLYEKSDWVEIPLSIYPSFVKVERA